MNIAITSSSFETYADLESLCLEKGISIKKNLTKKRFDEKELIDFIDQETIGCICGLEKFNENIFKHFPNLKFLSRIGGGIDSINQLHAAERSIEILNTPDAPTYAVSELTVGMLIALSRKINEHVLDMSNKIWIKRNSFGLDGKKVLIVGYGRIGKMTAKLLEAFQCEVLINDPFLSDKSIQTVSIEKGIRESDFIILHCSGNDQILTKELLFNCKEGVTILNPSRFQNIDESALKIGLKTGKIDRLWLDVFDNEPYNGELLELCNVIATPHIASHTKATREKMERESFLNLLNQI